MVGGDTNLGVSGWGGFGGGFGGFGGGFGGGGVVEGLVLGALLSGDGFGRRGHDGDDNGCANARFLALEGGLNSLSDQIQSQNVLGAIKDSATNAALRFDAVQNNINSVQTQLLLGGERTNGNISEVKFQNALNFQALGRQMSDCCCEIKETVMEDGDATRALITANTIQELRDKLADKNLELSQCKQNELWMTMLNEFKNFKEKQSDINIALGNTVTNTNTLLNSIAGRLPGLSQG